MLKEQLKQLLSSPSNFFSYRKDQLESRLLSDKTYIRKRFKKKMGYELPLECPVTFNEKLQWLKLYDRRPILSKMADKYLAREYVKKKVGDNILIPLIDVYDHPDEINWDVLPNQFALKATHGSGWNVICLDKKDLDLNKVNYLLGRYYNTNYFYMSREWAYKNIKPRFIVEKLLLDENLKPPSDWKFFVFNGQVEYLQHDRFKFTNHTRNFYDKDLEKIDLKMSYPNYDYVLQKPGTYENMKEIAEKLSDNLPFARVDLYTQNDRIYFGEITLYDGAGYNNFQPVSWDRTFGKLIKLRIK